MKRNWDLARHILLMADGRNVERVKFDLGNLGYTEDDVDFHLSILGMGKGDAGFIKTTSKNSGGRVDYLGDLMMRSGMVKEIFLHLTWQGMEFVELISSDESWAKWKTARGISNEDA